jgi:hypothetical protein
MPTIRAMNRRTARAHAGRLPDDRVVIATALLALSTLALMLCVSVV